MVKLIFLPIFLFSLSLIILFDSPIMHFSNAILRQTFTLLIFYSNFYVNLNSRTFSTSYYQLPRYPEHLHQTLGKSEHSYKKKKKKLAGKPGVTGFFQISFI